MTVVLISAGLAVGLIVGRWWALLACVGLGVWIGLIADGLEVPGWYLGFWYAVLSGLGIVAGVLLRRYFAKRS